MHLEDCLPPAVRDAGATITRIAAGLSGAGVYRVESAGATLVLKVSSDAEPLAAWQRRVRIHSSAADAGVAPRVVHVDEKRRAVVSEFIADQGFPLLFRNPARHDRAVALLGETLRRVHDIAPPEGAAPDDGRVLLAEVEQRLDGRDAVPDFVRDGIRRVLGDEPPPPDQAPGLSHNDVNPSNLAYDGERLVLLDWDVAGVNDPTFDLATIALFLRMDEPTSLAMLSAHDGTRITELPARFIYNRRLAGMMCGALGVDMALRRGHPGASAATTIESTMALGDFYQAMRSGRLNLATPDGQWAFGLALVKESLARV
jgi:aminoglycoside phosphotransferase (APT) family kinase protein